MRNWGHLVKWIAGGMRHFAYWTLCVFSRKSTDPGLRGSVMVVAPHPDDETVGCGGLIALARRRNIPVTIVVATDGTRSNAASLVAPAALGKTRSDELSRATKRLGVSSTDVIELAYPDLELDRHTSSLADDLRRIIVERCPKDVYVTCMADPHPDHAAASRAVRLAISGCELPPRLLEYPIWLWSEWPVSRRYRWGSGLVPWIRILRHRAVESVNLESVREVKERALVEYVSQVGPMRGDRLDPTMAQAVPWSLPIEVIDRALKGPELFFCNFGE